MKQPHPSSTLGGDKSASLGRVNKTIKRRDENTDQKEALENIKGFYDLVVKRPGAKKSVKLRAVDVYSSRDYSSGSFLEGRPKETTLSRGSK